MTNKPRSVRGGGGGITGGCVLETSFELPQNGIDLSPLPRIAEKMQFTLPLQPALQGGPVVREL